MSLEVGRHYLFRRVGVRPSSGSGSGSGSSAGTPAAIVLGGVCPSSSAGSGSGSGQAGRWFGKHIPVLRRGVRNTGGSGSGSGEGLNIPAGALPLGVCGPNGELQVGQHYLFKRIGVREVDGVVTPAAIGVCQTCGSGSGSGSGGSGSGSGSGSGDGSGSGSGSGSGIEGSCCGCPDPTQWPATLTCSLTTTCMGSVTITLTQNPIAHLCGIYYTGTLVTAAEEGSANGTDCVTAAGSNTTIIQTTYTVTLECIASCVGVIEELILSLSIGGSYGTIIGNIVFDAMVTVASCDPIVLNEFISDPAVCRDEDVDDPCCPDNAVVTFQCDPPTTNFDETVGCVVTVNISE